MLAPNQDSTTDLLEWWKVDAQEYPHLAKLDKQYMYLCTCICATSCTLRAIIHVASKKKDLP